MKILSKRHTETVTHFEMFFANVGSNGNSGYGFPCDAVGNLRPLENDCAKANLAKCLAGEGVEAGVLKSWATRCTHSAVGQCDHCGAEVCLSGFTNECECGTDYNMSGQMLGSRESWGEETGESLSEILSIP